MKVSKYFSAISLSEDTWLLYAALNDAFVVVSKNVLPNVKEPVLLQASGKLREDLISAGIIVERVCDEVAILEERIMDIDNCNKLLQLTVNPTINCNFSCWYCYEHHAKNTKMSPETCDAVVKYLNNYLERNVDTEEFTLSFFGGEPLIYFRDVVMPLIKECEVVCCTHGVCFNVHFTTNGYLLSDECVAFLSNYNSSFQITLDGSESFHDKIRFPKPGVGSYSRIMHNIMRAAKAACRVIVRLNYTSENIDSLDSVINDLNNFPIEIKKYIQVDFQRVWQDITPDGLDSITNKIAEYFRKTINCGIAATSHYTFDLVRTSCYGDKRDYMLVNYNGELYKCTARDFANTPCLGKLASDGSVEWNKEICDIRSEVKLSKVICRECRIAPLCGGGCRQKAMECIEKLGCIYNYSEQAKDQIILDRFEFTIVR